jgi:hypothetical protein
MDQRKGARWICDGKNKAKFIFDNLASDVLVADVSTSGMRAIFPYPVNVGTEVTGKLEFSYDQVMYRIPFTVKGQVVRVFESNGKWEAGVSFTKLMRGVNAA